MSTRLRLTSFAFAACCGLGSHAVYGTSTDGYHKILVVPAVVKSSTYTTSFFVHNPATTQATVHFTFFKGVNYGATMDQQSFDCGSKVIAPGQVLSFPDLPSLCPSVPPSAPPNPSLYGWIWAEEVTPGTTIPVTIFTRVDNALVTNGFETEAYPAHTFTGAPAYVLGLKRTGDGVNTGIKSNCYVAALGEPTTVSLSLVSGANGATIGGPVTVSLPATQMVRFLDFFGSPGGYSNAALKITTTPTATTPPAYPGVISFCTVENVQSRDADLRIGKASPVFDNQVSRSVVENSDEAGVIFSTGASGSDRNRHVVYFKHPDVVECLLGSFNGSNPANLEMLLRDPEGVERARAAGNVGFTGLYTGEKSAHGALPVVKGVNGKWTLDVQSLNASGLNNQYQIACRAGSGFGGHEWVGRNLPHAP